MPRLILISNRSLLERKVAEDKKSLTPSLEERAKKMTDGFGLNNIGFNYVLHGELAKGLELMEFASGKPNKKPAESALEFGFAAYLANDVPKAKTIFANVKGSPGVLELAKLWTIYLGNQK